MTNSVDPDQLASKKPTDLELHCLQRQDISGFSRTRVKDSEKNTGGKTPRAAAPGDPQWNDLLVEIDIEKLTH